MKTLPLRSVTSLNCDFLPAEKLSFSTAKSPDKTIQGIQDILASSNADHVFVAVPLDATVEQLVEMKRYPFDLNASDDEAKAQAVEMQAAKDAGHLVVHYLPSATLYYEWDGETREGSQTARLGRLGGNTNRRGIA